MSSMTLFILSKSEFPRTRAHLFSYLTKLPSSFFLFDQVWLAYPPLFYPWPTHPPTYLHTHPPTHPLYLCQRMVRWLGHQLVRWLGHQLVRSHFGSSYWGSRCAPQLSTSVRGKRWHDPVLCEYDDFFDAFAVRCHFQTVQFRFCRGWLCHPNPPPHPPDQHTVSQNGLRQHGYGPPLDQLTDQLTDLLIDQLFDQLADQLTDQLTIQFTDQLT